MNALDLIRPTYASVAASATDGTLKDALKLVSLEDVAGLFDEDELLDDVEIDADVLKDLIYEMAQGRYHALDDNNEGKSVSVTKTDVNDDGDTDKVTIDADDDGQPEVEIESADDSEEQNALNELDDMADKDAKSTPFHIEQVDAMADEAANDNDLSLDKVDATADEAAHSRDSTGNVADYEKKKTSEQLALEALVSGRQKNILAALQDRLM